MATSRTLKEQSDQANVLIQAYASTRDFTIRHYGALGLAILASLEADHGKPLLLVATATLAASLIYFATWITRRIRA